MVAPAPSHLLVEMESCVGVWLAGRVVAVVRLYDTQGSRCKSQHVAQQNRLCAIQCILAEGAIALPVTLSGGVLFAS